MLVIEVLKRGGNTKRGRGKVIDKLGGGEEKRRRQTGRERREKKVSKINEERGKKNARKIHKN